MRESAEILISSGLAAAGAFTHPFLSKLVCANKLITPLVFHCSGLRLCCSRVQDTSISTWTVGPPSCQTGLPADPVTHLFCTSKGSGMSYLLCRCYSISLSVHHNHTARLNAYC